MQHIFGIRIKELRESRELNQSELARVFNVTKQTISAWENSLQETDFNMLLKIAQYFEVTIDYLLGLEN